MAVVMFFLGAWCAFAVILAAIILAGIFTEWLDRPHDPVARIGVSVAVLLWASFIAVAVAA